MDIDIQMYAYTLLAESRRRPTPPTHAAALQTTH